MTRDREVWTALVLIVVANAIFISALALEWLPIRLYAKGRFLLLGLVLVSVVGLVRGRKGLFDLIRPMGVWRINPLWFAFAGCWAAAISVVTLVLKGLYTGNGLGEIHTDFSVVTIPSVWQTILLGSFVGEIVWVSYALGRLSKSTTTFAAAMIVGIFWTLWWVPIVLIGIGVIPGLPLVPLLVNMLGVAAMCGFIYYHTKSGIAVLLLQIGLNSSILIFPVTPEVGGVGVYWAFGVVYSAAALLLYLVFGPKPLFRRSAATIADQALRA